MCVCVCLHDRHCGDNLLNTHQRCGYILNCGDFTWVPRIKMLDSIQSVLKQLNKWVIKMSPQKKIVCASFFYGDLCVVM